MSKRCLGCMELFGDDFTVCPHCGYLESTPVETQVNIHPGEYLDDRYIVGKVLGYGGFGVTYIGWDGKLEQKVAIKEYFPSEFSTRMPGKVDLTVFNGDKGEQFHDGMVKYIEEGRKLAKFRDESGIVRVYDSFEANHTAYIIMEYVEGETLKELLEREKFMPEKKAIEMLRPIMTSLKSVHKEGIIHRDISPDNIMVSKTGEAKLIDFGASRYATATHSRSLTVMIKPGYSPLEQYGSSEKQGTYTDVYALAATLYKMITGKTPPGAIERRTKFETQKKELLEFPHKLKKDIHVNTEIAILNAMNIRIQDRTPDIETFEKELDSETRVKRKYGKIKKLDFYTWPVWVKCTVGALAVALITFSFLLATGIVHFKTSFTEEVVIPDGKVKIPEVEGLSREEAIKRLEDSSLHSMATGSVNSEYLDAGRVVLQDPIGGSVVDELTMVNLTVSRGSGIEASNNGISTVPYVEVQSLEEAKEALQIAGLGEPEIEERYDEYVAAGLVISQSIGVGEKVDEGTSIKLVVSLGPTPFEMPDVSGKDEMIAKNELQEKALAVEVKYEESAGKESGKVLRQSPVSGSNVKKGDKVTIWVSYSDVTPTASVTPTPTPTPRPIITNTPKPIITNTPSGTHTNTPKPIITNTPIPTPKTVIICGEEYSTNCKELSIGESCAIGPNIMTDKDADNIKYMIQLESLRIGEAAITNIDFLKGLKNLREFYGYFGNELSNINVIGGLVKLESLSIGGINVVDCSVFKKLNNLTDLGVYSSEIKNINSLKELKNLTQLSLTSDKISDISVLRDLTNLKELNLYDNSISNIEPLEKLTSLKTLDLSNNKIIDINALKGLSNLTVLFLNYNEISNVSALKGLFNLECLYLYGNNISEANIKEIQEALPNCNIYY